MAESWLICENGYQTKCVDCPIRDENAEPCEHAIKVAPVRYGQWITWEEAGNDIPSPHRHECSACHDAAQVLVNGVELLSDYCPNCGAKMDGAE